MSKEHLKAHFQKEIEATRRSIDASKIEKNRLAQQKKLELLSALQRYVEGKPNREDSLLADVINDMLQVLNLLDARKTFVDV